MRADGDERLRGVSRLGRLKSWARSHARPLLREALWLDFQDTLRRLLRRDFADLDDAEKRERVEQIIGLSSMAAMAMAAAPVPFLELPVQAAMVRGIARVYGQQKPGRQVMIELGAALGGGLVIKQAMRLLPFVGPLPHLSRVYGATYALGRVAQAYFATDDRPQPPELRALFQRTAEMQTEARSHSLKSAEVEQTLRTLDDLRARAVITEAEYRRKRDEVLASL